MKFALATVCSLLLIFTSFSLFGQDDSEFLTYKQKLMQSNGMHMGLIGQIMQKQMPFKGHVSSHAKVIQQNNQMFVDASHKKITDGKTDSKPDVWSKWDAFAEAGNNSSTAAAQLAQADEAEIMGKMRDLGGTCGACHQMFRKPQGERFAR